MSQPDNSLKSLIINSQAPVSKLSKARPYYTLYKAIIVKYGNNAQNATVLVDVEHLCWTILKFYKHLVKVLTDAVTKNL